jgi:hypothetical protein
MTTLKGSRFLEDLKSSQEKSSKNERMPGSPLWSSRLLEKKAQFDNLSILSKAKTRRLAGGRSASIFGTPTPVHLFH